MSNRKEEEEEREGLEGGEELGTERHIGRILSYKEEEE